MSDAGAADVAERLVDAYAADLLASEASPSSEAAAATARQQTDDALAQPGSVVLAAVTDGAQVGAVWLDVAADETFVLDILVSPEHRGRGYGRALMLATEDFARGRGCRSVALSVFGGNLIARRLYDTLGYQVTESFLGVDL
jgi:ribosomal protein S18 acetylase RimI-like enzyme